MLAVVNQGYINSNVPLRVALHCIEAADLQDITDASKMINTFRMYKDTVENLRQTADAAMLLVDNFSSCGIAGTK